MNETSTKVNKTRGGTGIQKWEIESTLPYQISLDDRKHESKSLLPVPYKIGECSHQKPHKKDSSRVLFSFQSDGSKWNTPSYTCKKINSEFMCRRIDANNEGIDWKMFLTKILTYPILGLIWVYRKFISPVFPSTCIYKPTCSQYAFEAVSKHGIKGVWMSIKRIARCRPGQPGGFDPVP